jgi:hypothetical protein
MLPRSVDFVDLAMINVRPVSPRPSETNGRSSTLPDRKRWSLPPWRGGPRIPVHEREIVQ